MKMRNVAIGAVICTAVMGVLGCDMVLSGRARQDAVLVQDRGPRYPDQQVVVVDQPPQYVMVQQAPPPMRVEYRPVAPSADVVWVDGYWNWNNTSYVWQAGQYRRPPQPDVVWISPRYETIGGSVRITQGRWSNGPGNRGGNGGNGGDGRGGNGGGNAGGDGRGRGRGN